MSNLENRNEDLYKLVRAYPNLVYELISFVTEPAVVKLLSAGGQNHGELTFTVVKGEVVSLKPSMELKRNYEIT